MATLEQVQAGLATLSHALGRSEPDEALVETWARAFRTLDGRRFLLACDEMATTVERSIPPIAQVLKVVEKMREPVQPGIACPDCVEGRRGGFYRLTRDEFDQANRWVRRVRTHAHVLLACTCEAGQRFGRLGPCDVWLADRRAQIMPGTDDVVWLANRHERVPPTSVEFPSRAQSVAPVRPVAGFATPGSPARPRPTRDWHETERDEDEEAAS